MMVTIGMNYQVLPGKEKMFEDVFAAVLKAMGGMPGHTRTNLYRDVQDPARYLIVSDWSDRQAFDAFIASEQFRSVANWGKEQILAGRPTHDYYQR
ncbi:MAG: antibiotic biosynthesis monooxygenase family protein [Phycisphaeraceae bacterium]